MKTRGTEALPAAGTDAVRTAGGRAGRKGSSKKDRKHAARLKGGAAALAALITLSVAYSVSAPMLTQKEKESVPADPTHVYELEAVPETLEDILAGAGGEAEEDEEEKKRGFLYSIRAFLAGLAAAIRRFFRKLLRTVFSPKNIWAVVIAAISLLIFVLREFWHITVDI